MNPSIDPFDELAALFLTEPDEGRRPRDGRSVAPSELLLVGHLPVRAGVWLAPYVDALARTAGPTALLRLDDSVPHLQLLRGSELPEEELNLRRTIESLQSEVNLWVVRPPSNEPARRLVECGASRITLLTGADEAALVAAYQTIKQLAATAEDLGRTLPPIGISVMGCDETTARSAVKRLNQTTHSFLAIELSLVLCLPRMDAGMISSGYRRVVAERCPELAEVLSWIGQGGPASPPAAPAAPAPPVADRPAPLRVEAAPPVEPAAPPVVETVRGAADAVTPAPAPDRPPARLVPKAGIELEPKQPSEPREPDDGGRPVALATHVEGLTPLAVRCPGSEDVELAVDREGRVHLLARDASLRHLPVVKRWAFEHRELIAMACPDQTIDGRLPPVGHLFTATPLSVADLHATEFRLHVLAPVRVGDRVGWYSSPLNRP
jgi:hypothetical protein